VYIDTDPRGVFLQVAAVVRAGKRDYEYEQFAQDVVLRIVRRYLADKRALVQDDEECQRALRCWGSGKNADWNLDSDLEVKHYPCWRMIACVFPRPSQLFRMQGGRRNY
jgi:hypothetical protein